MGKFSDGGNLGLGLCRIGRGGYRSADTSAGLLETKDR